MPELGCASGALGAVRVGLCYYVNCDFDGQKRIGYKKPEGEITEIGVIAETGVEAIYCVNLKVQGQCGQLRGREKGPEIILLYVGKFTFFNCVGFTLIPEGG